MLKRDNLVLVGGGLLVGFAAGVLVSRNTNTKPTQTHASEAGTPRKQPLSPQRQQASVEIPDRSLFVGVDVGGTKVAVCIVDNACKELAKVSAEHTNDKSPKAIVATIDSLIREAVKSANKQFADIAAIGVGIPGAIDADQGVVLRVANLPWENVPLAQEIENVTGIECHVQNDAKSAVIGEWWHMLSTQHTNYKHIAMVTVGTGVGGAFISDGNLVMGAGGMAGEIGHTIVQKNGRWNQSTGVGGILEMYASGTAIGEIAEEQLKQQKLQASPPPLSSLSTEPHITSKAVFAHAAKGDALCQRIILEAAEYLGIGCINICRHFDPEVIVLSGGVVQAGPGFVGAVQEAFRKHHWNIHEQRCQILVSQLGDSAGCVGAAGVAKLGRFGSLAGSVQLS